MLKKFTLFFLTICFIFFAYIPAFAADIVSPSVNSISYADSLLVSIKLSDQKKVQITVYKEQISIETEITDENGTKQIETIYSDVDAQKLTSNDLSLIAEGKTEDEEGNPVLLSSGEEIPEYIDSIFSEMVEYTNPTTGISFYTKKITEVTPGLYKVEVKTLDEKSVVLETTVSYTAVQTPPEEKKDIFSENQTGAFQFLQKFLKNLFK